MRAAHWSNGPRYELKRLGRRLHIWASPVLGWIVCALLLLAGLIVLWTVGLVLIIAMALRLTGGFVGQLLFRPRTPKLPAPAADCVFISGRSLEEIAELLSRDRRFMPDQAER